MRFTVGCVCALLFATTAMGACPGDGPEVVLDFFSRAYSERSEELLDMVMAPDYTWVTVAPPEVDIFPREESFDSSVRMFGNESVEWVSLEFREGFDVVEGVEPGTWRIENLLATLKVKSVGAKQPSVAPLCVTFYVRKLEGEGGGFEVFREVFFEGEGCVRK